MWAKTFPRSSGMISPDIGHSISVERRLLWIRLDRGGGKLVGLLQNPHYPAEIWSGSQFEDNPSFSVVNLWAAGNCALADHDLFEVRWQPEFYPVGAVYVREGFASDMQLDLFISMVLHLDTGNKKHLASNHIQ